MKEILEQIITDDDVRFLIRQAKIRAAEGDNEALRIILAYKYGTPTTIHSKKPQPTTSNGNYSGGNKQGAPNKKELKARL